MTGREQELRALAASPDFAELLESDPEIRRLDAQRRSKPLERLILVEALGGALTLAGIPVLPLTPAKWAVLYMTGNAFACCSERLTMAHIDQFVWLVTHDLSELSSFDTLGEVAKDYCQNAGIDRDEAFDDIIQLREVAFYPLQMLPSVNSCGIDPEFDAEWLTRVCCMAHASSGIPVPELMHSTALSTVCYYFVQNERKSDIKNVIRKPSDQEINAAIIARTNELAKEFLKHGS